MRQLLPSGKLCSPKKISNRSDQNRSEGGYINIYYLSIFSDLLFHFIVPLKNEFSIVVMLVYQRVCLDSYGVVTSGANPWVNVNSHCFLQIDLM